MITLPIGYILRRPVAEDAPALADLMIAHDIDMNGQADTVLSDVLDNWHDIDLENNAWLVLTEAGQMVGYEEVYPMQHGRIAIDGFVHPDHASCGIGSYLVSLAEARAQELISTFPPDYEIFISAGHYSQDNNAIGMFAAFGYELVRYFYRMTITFDTPPSPVAWPAGYTLCSFRADSDGPLMYDLHMRSFSNHFGFAVRPYETWHGHTLGSIQFREDLWFYASDANGTPAGFALNYLREDNTGWVGVLGVLDEHRGRGLGMAVLQHSFALLYAAGAQTIELGVDASNSTGAVGLYERAGMSVRVQYSTQEKIIRPGLRQSVS